MYPPARIDGTRTPLNLVGSCDAPTTATRRAFNIRQMASLFSTMVPLIVVDPPSWVWPAFLECAGLSRRLQQLQRDLLREERLRSKVSHEDALVDVVRPGRHVGVAFLEMGVKS